MATVVDLLRQLGKDAAPDGGNALVGPITLPPVVPVPHHVGAPAELLATWTRVTGRTPELQHSHVLTALRSGEAVAIAGQGGDLTADLLLLTLAHLAADPKRRGLWLAAERSDLAHAAALLTRLQPALRWQAVEDGGRPRAAALTLLTYDDLHRRLLPSAERGWRWLWSDLALVALPALDAARGAAAGHLRWLLRRTSRFARDLQLLGAIGQVAGAAAACHAILGQPPHLIDIPVGSPTSTLVALWRTGGDRWAAIAELAAGLARFKLALTALGRDDIETALLRDRLPAEVPVGLPPAAARVALVGGVPEAATARATALRSGYRLIVMVVGDTPLEQIVAANPDLLLGAGPGWPVAVNNAEIDTSEVLCAANERPLTRAEVIGWKAERLVDTLVTNNRLQPIDNEWQLVPTTAEPHSHVDLATVRGTPLHVINPAGNNVAIVSSAIADRCAIGGATWAPGQVVGQRSQGVISLEWGDEARATWPVESSHVVVEAELGSEACSWGREFTWRCLEVRVTTRLRGLLELAPDRPLQMHSVGRSEERRWTGTALELPIAIQTDHPAPAWSLLATLPLIGQAHPAALLPFVDRDRGRLILIEVEPGNVGLVAALAPRLQDWLDLAYTLARATVSHSIYTPLARAELEWLEAFRASGATFGEHVEPEVVASVAPTPTEMVGDEATARAPRQRRPRIYAALEHQSPVESTMAVPQPDLEHGPFPAHASPPTVEPTPEIMQRPLVVDQAVEPPDKADVDRAPAPVAAVERAHAPVLPVEVAGQQVEPAAVDQGIDAIVVDGGIFAPATDHQGASRHGNEPRTAAEPSDLGDDDLPLGELPPYLRRAQQRLLAKLHRPVVSQAQGSTEPAQQAAGQQIREQPTPFNKVEPTGASARATMSTAPDHASETIGSDDSSSPASFATPSQAPETAAAATHQPVSPNAASPATRQTALPEAADPASPFASIDDDEDVTWEPDPRPPSTPPVQQRRPVTPPRYPPARPQRPARQATERPAQATRGPGKPPVPPPFGNARQPTQGNQPQPVPGSSRSRPASSEAPTGDVGGMIARLRQMREAQQGADADQPRRPPADSHAERQVTPRFRVGERVRCVPYGEGIVRATRIVGGREQLRVEFPEDGVIAVDPQVSLVRSLASPDATEGLDEA